MEYLTSIDENLKTIDETNVVYYNLFNFPQYFYGSLNFTSNELNFSKFPNNVISDMEKYGNEISTGIRYNNLVSCGNRLRFSTSSNKIIFKIQLKRKWPFQKIINWNSMGFDIYSVKNGKYTPLSLFAPKDGFNIFAELVNVSPNEELCVFLPSYSTIEKMYIGVENDSKLYSFDYPKFKQLPIIFYGNSITQGAAASRSGNTFPNIVSRYMDRDIINLSSSAGCIGIESIAELIGKINCHSIVIDYTKNAPSLDVFEKTYFKFYSRIRDFHPNKKIIFLTSDHYNDWGLRLYAKFDDVIKEVYNVALSRGDNVGLLQKFSLFEKNEWDYIAVDAGHYTDYGMFKIANELCNLID